MSNFSYPCEFPVGITILDLTDSDKTIADLDLAAARAYVEFFNSFNPTSTNYNEWNDNYVGSMWPIGMTFADAMYYYWNASTLNFSGVYADFPQTNNGSINLFSGESYATLTSNFVNFRNNYDCPESGYNAVNFGDHFYTSKIVSIPNNCLSSSDTHHAVKSFDYDNCQVVFTDLEFAVAGFTATLSDLNEPFFGGDGTRESLRQNYPSLIKIGNLYYPAIRLSFYWLPDQVENPQIITYGVFNASTFSVLRRQRKSEICAPINDPSFTFLGLTYESGNGPYFSTLNGFPSGNSYDIPIYNIYSCVEDDNNNCPNFSRVCDPLPFNIEMGDVQITSGPL